MVILAILIPIITCFVLAFLFKDKVVWWEYFVVFIPSILCTLSIYLAIKYSTSSDTEYLGYYVSRVEYYEDWDEYIHQTCYETVTVGYDSEGNAITEDIPYDCSYVDYHPEEFYAILNGGAGRRWISKGLYNEITEKLKTGPVFKDLHRDYYTNDGDMWYSNFNGDRDRMWTVTEKGRYKNKILGSRSIFNFSEVTEEEFDTLDLYDYPEIVKLDQNPIIGISVPASVIDSFQYLNSYYGGLYQFRCYVMCFKNKPLEIAEKERDFLVGGNKNELVVCISVNDSDRIQWVSSFSWEDLPKIVTGVNHLYKAGDELDLMKLNRYLLTHVPNDWKRKEFVDFDYITRTLTQSEWLWVIIATILINIGLSVFVVKNEYNRIQSW